MTVSSVRNLELWLFGLSFYGNCNQQRKKRDDAIHRLLIESQCLFFFFFFFFFGAYFNTPRGSLYKPQVKYLRPTLLAERSLGVTPVASFSSEIHQIYLIIRTLIYGPLRLKPQQ